MIFYLHYILLTSGLSGTSVLLGVFFKFYSDASQTEIGALLMSFPFSSLIIKPLFCSMADKRQAHRVFLIWSLIVLIAGYLPFLAIPYFPDFYTQHPRAVWYLLIVSCFVGNSGLSVAWSLGDTLAVNIAAKRGQSFGRYRLFGTLSWGVYGYIIGQINEHPAMPKYTPSFVILIISVLIEIVCLVFWKDEEFMMFDADLQRELEAKSKATSALEATAHFDNLEYDWTSASLGGSVRISPQAARALREMVSDQLPPRTQDLEGCNTIKSSSPIQQAQQKSLDHERPLNSVEHKGSKNPQIVLFKMIWQHDKRLIKYMIFALISGYLISVMNFLFMGLEENAISKGYNFSNLAGSILISQAGIETLCFLALPLLVRRFSRTVLVSSVLIISTTRYLFYSFAYYSSDISPYWALVGEWGHGIPYAISVTVLAELALLFANQCKFFIPEMKQLGFMKESTDKKKMQEEEDKIRMALRASMQAIFGGLMDGGYGFGCLVCGVVVEAFGYIALWQSMALVSIASLVLLIINEMANTKLSDEYKPKPGTKAFEIRTASS